MSKKKLIRAIPFFAKLFITIQVNFFLLKKKIHWSKPINQPTFVATSSHISISQMSCGVGKLPRTLAPPDVKSSCTSVYQRDRGLGCEGATSQCSEFYSSVDKRQA